MAQPAWKTAAGAISAYLLAILFVIAGVWKLTDPLGAAVRMNQALVPAVLSLPAAVAFGIAELFSAALLVIPRFRRWGAWLTGLMLVAFLAYFAIFYNALRGADCSCFPWIKRAVGPGFFISDGIMLLLALAAGWWARRPDGLKQAAVILAVVTVFAGASFTWVQMHLTGTKAPASIIVKGQPYSLEQGRIMIYFFDPECSHCYAAAKLMSTFHWNSVKIVSVPTRMPQFADGFLNDTGFKSEVSPDLAKLKAVFPFGDGPYGVLLEHGRLKTPLPTFDEQEPYQTLKKMGWVE